MLMEMTVKNFIDLIASDAPAPGGGSVAALNGAIGAALITMVCRLSIGRKELNQYEEDLLLVLEKADRIRLDLSELVDRDTQAFTQVMNALNMAKTTAREKETRDCAIQEAFRIATEVPLDVAEHCCALMELSVKLSQMFNFNTASDLGVSAQCSYGAAIGALMNVKINIPTINDRTYVSKLLEKTGKIRSKAETLRQEIDNKIDHILSIGN